MLQEIVLNTLEEGHFWFLPETNLVLTNGYRKQHPVELGTEITETCWQAKIDAFLDEVELARGQGGLIVEQELLLAAIDCQQTPTGMVAVLGEDSEYLVPETVFVEDLFHLMAALDLKYPVQMDNFIDGNTLLYFASPKTGCYMFVKVFYSSLSSVSRIELGLGYDRYSIGCKV